MSCLARCCTVGLSVPVNDALKEEADDSPFAYDKVMKRQLSELFSISRV